MKKTYIVAPALPSQESPGAGLVAYNIARHAPHCLRIVAMQGNLENLDFPSYVEACVLSVRHAPLSKPIKDKLYFAEDGNLFSMYAKLRAVRTSGVDMFFIKAVNDLIRFSPDLVVGHSLFALPIGAFAKSILRKKFVLWLHNVTESVLISRHPFLLKLVSQADLVICISSDVQKHLTDIAPGLSTTVITTGVDLTQFSELALHREKQIIAVGSFKWKKGYHILLEAAARFLPQFPEYKLIIVGDGPLRGDITAQIEQLGLVDRIQLMGILPQDQLAILLNRSQLFVITSLYEGLPKVILEALACGTPIVVTDACNVDEYLDGAGVIVPSNDYQAFSQAVIKMLDSPQAVWLNRSMRAVQIAKKFDWRLIGSAAWACYQSVNTE
jgi:glycosyltransferase involved in cell wall biosynthesis